MTRKRRLDLSVLSRGSAPSSSATPRRDQDTIYSANELIGKNDIIGLRKLAAIRGLVTHGLRSRAWPLILGVHEQPHEQYRYESQTSMPHKDSHVVDCDMARSLWSWTQGWTEAARNERRAALKRVIDATICGNSRDIYYYQGLHDIAAVLLFVLGEPTAHRMLDRLVTSQLRDCTRPNLDAAIEVLSLLYPILQVADPELHRFITSLDEPALDVPYFALSWHMTWFSHDVPSLDQCARLFDLFISSHPLMPLYVAAIALRDQRDAVLRYKKDGGDCHGDGDMVYATLKGMTFLGPGQLDADNLAQQAAALYRQAPPTYLMRKSKKTLIHSTTLDAYIEDGRWYVPDAPSDQRKKRKRLASVAFSTVVSDPIKKRPKTAAMVVGMGLAGAALLGTSMLLSLLQTMGP